MALVKYNNSIVIQFDTEVTGNAGSGKAVTVQFTGSSILADLFDDDDNLITNPVNADDQGNYGFKVEAGVYDIYIDKDEATEVVLTQEEIGGAGGGTGALNIYDSMNALRLADLVSNEYAVIKGYYGPDGFGAANFIIQTPAQYGGVPDEIVDVTIGNGNIAVNIEQNLLGSMGGMLSDAGDYTANLQALANKLSPIKTLHIDSTSYTLSGFVLFNNGFKKVSHASDCVVFFTGAGEPSTTSKALYSINLGADGLRTNETILTTTTAETTEGENTFVVASAAGFNIGDVIRVDKHICRIVVIDGLNLETDRTLPIPTMAIGSEVARLDMPNIGSEFSGPGRIQFAPNNTTQVYGFGAIAALCYDFRLTKMYGYHNASRLAEIFYCADSVLDDVYQHEPTDALGGGQSYAARISNGNDNEARNIRSYKGRHCVDITFSHRNKVFDCKDNYGVQASYLTHFNGCRYNDFIRCDLFECDFGVYLDDDGGDFQNRILDSLFYNSRGLYRFVATSSAERCRFINTEVKNFRDTIVPAGSGTSVFNMIDCEIDIVNDFCNVDDDYTLNMTGGSYTSTRLDGMVRGSDVAPGSATIVFNIKNAYFNFQIGQGRYNRNVTINFTNCTIDFFEQPFGEEIGNQNYYGNTMTCTNPSDRYIVTVGTLNENEFFNNIVKGTDLYFRFFDLVAFPSGKITFGDNTFEKPMAPNILEDMNWETKGFVSLPIARTNNGTPTNGSVVYIDEDSAAFPFKRKRVGGAWVDWTV